MPESHRQKFTDGSIETAELADGIFAASAAGRAKMADGFTTVAKCANDVIAYADKTLTAAQVKALNGTPIEVLAKPAAGAAVIPVGAIAFMDYGTVAYDGVAEGEDLTLRYKDGNGAQLLTFETTGFLDQGSDQIRYAFPVATNITPATEAVVAHMAAGDIATGDSPIKIRFYYRLISLAL